jgi:hypothetical protein
MRTLFCLIAVCAACISCRREAGDPRARGPAGFPKTNVVSKLDEKGRPTETMVYATNGVLKQRTFFETAADGRIMTARTVDAEGRPKWTEQYSYGQTGDRRPVELRRTKPDGQIIAVRFLYSPDGTQRKIVIGPDGKQIPEAEQAAFLEE